MPGKCYGHWHYWCNICMQRWRSKLAVESFPNVINKRFYTKQIYFYPIEKASYIVYVYTWDRTSSESYTKDAFVHMGIRTVIAVLEFVWFIYWKLRIDRDTTTWKIQGELRRFERRSLVGKLVAKRRSSPCIFSGIFIPIYIYQSEKFWGRLFEARLA